jgi:hypothetical protein
MLGFTNERMPKTGALGLALMGGAGMLSVSFVLPYMGDVYDNKTAEAAGGAEVVETIRAAAEGTAEHAQWLAAQADGGAAALRVVAILPVALIIVFGAMFIRDRMAGGYKAESLGGDSGTPAE